MTALAKTLRRWAGAAWARHGAALATALVLNGALVYFLVAWRSRERHAGPTPVRAVPLRVVETEPRRADLAEPEPAEAVVVEPPEAPPLPVPPVPQMPATLVLEAPAPLEVPLSASPATDVPLYVSKALDPVLGAPAPVRVRPPAPAAAPGARPQRVGSSRGPVMVKPPNLSDYYPRRARMRGVTGKTQVRLTLDADGKVAQVAVLSSTPEGVFDTAARRVGRSLRFQPALRENRPVATSVVLNLVWRLE